MRIFIDGVKCAMLKQVEGAAVEALEAGGRRHGFQRVGGRRELLRRGQDGAHLPLHLVDGGEQVAARRVLQQHRCHLTFELDVKEPGIESKSIN